ncbi:MAG: hypothetical protein IJ157_06785 [Clostridia bacterium]|nr:hypothetical protein [Clostridia bacterium]
MKRLDNLPEITDQMLGGLHASQELKNDILRDAALASQGQTVRRSTPWQKRPAAKARVIRAVAALACAALVITGAVMAAPNLLSRPDGQTSLIDTQAAGDVKPLSGGQSVALDMPRGSVVISQRSQPSYRGIWEAAQGGNFPLVCVDGRYYRLMSNPTALGSSLQGEALGAVDTYTSEPALVQGGIVSNVVAQGETVYAVRGMANAAVAAPVNGEMRVFQRVSFGASALKGGETLASTLGSSSVAALELTGVGTVTDAAKAQELYGILTSSAQLVRAGSGETAESLLIGLQNGLVLQMSVRDESLMACGTWSCPEFFEAFEAAIQ